MIVNVWGDVTFCATRVHCLCLFSFRAVCSDCETLEGRVVVV